MSTPLVRKSNDKLFAGVAGRLAKRFDLDTGLVRAGFVIALAAEPITTLLVYLVLAYLLPRIAVDAGASSRRVSTRGMRSGHGATTREAYVTGLRLATALGAVAFAISRAALVAGRAAAVAGTSAFRTRQPAQQGNDPATSPQPLPHAGRPVLPVRPPLRPAKRARVAPTAGARTARASGVAPVPARAPFAQPRPAPAARQTAPSRPAAEAIAPQPRAAAPTATPRAWMSDEERLEADVRAAVARTEEQARRDLAATAAATQHARRMRRSRRVRRTVGALVVTGGTLWLVGQASAIAPGTITIDLQAPAIWAIVLMAGGTWLVISSLWRR